MAVLPTAITGLEVPPPRPAGRWPTPRATAAESRPMAPPIIAPGPARSCGGRPAAGSGSVDVLSATEPTVRVTAPNVTRTVRASFLILWQRRGAARRRDRKDRRDVSSEQPIGVLVMAYGTAAGPEDIERYYTDIRGGRPPSPEHLVELRSRYAAIGDR